MWRSRCHGGPSGKSSLTALKEAVRCVYELLGQESFEELDGLVTPQLLQAKKVGVHIVIIYIWGPLE